MAPAEIWQGGKIVNRVQGNNLHIGKIDAKKVIVEDSEQACKFIDKHGTGIPGLNPLGVGNSITLDGGEIVKSVRE